MKYGKLEIFLIKRIAVVYLVLSALAAIFLANRLLVIAGLTFGGIAGILRLNFIASLLVNLFAGNTAPHGNNGPADGQQADGQQDDGEQHTGGATGAPPEASAELNRKTMRSTIRYVISLFGMLALLVASMLYDPWLFVGVTAGVLILPLYITVNGITEGFRITHNRFGA